MILWYGPVDADCLFQICDDDAVGFFTFASMFDILSTGSSCYFAENDWVVRLCSLFFLTAKPQTLDFKYWLLLLLLCRWFIPINVICGTIAGSLIGLVVATIIRPPYPFFKFTVIHVGIGEPLYPGNIFAFILSILENYHFPMPCMLYYILSFNVNSPTKDDGWQNLSSYWRFWIISS